MGEKMQFPATVEEFMQQYKIIDTEQIYSNGMELVPIHRMRQWFDHIADVQPATWIPVTEQLPDTNERVLFCGVTGRMWVARKFTGVDNGRVDTYDNGRWRYATHWMPLPEPPDGGADG